LGNQLPEAEQDVTFTVTSTTAGRKGRFSDKHLKRGLGVPQIVKDLSSQFGWTVCKDKRPTLSFHLSSQHSNKDDEKDSQQQVQYSLELTALVRVFPLREKDLSPTKQRQRTPKRIESFVVARSANVLPNDIVWSHIFDRSCQVLATGSLPWYG
jgi:hypothetical protein